MPDAFAASWIARPIAAAIVESLWQGAVIAAVAALLLRALRAATPNARYLVACIGLALLIACWIGTAVRHAEPPRTGALAPRPPASTATFSTMTTASGDLVVQIASRAPASARPWRAYVDAWAIAIAAAWLLGVSFFSVQLTLAWAHVRRLRRGVHAALPVALQPRAARIVQIVDVRRPVEIVQCAIVHVPTVVGWLRPIVLLPASALAGLPPAQIDAVIAHELAHVRRHDYLVNLVQRVVETVLFYHPACWWLSRQIREAREQCCDDVAVAACGDGHTYATALATLETLRVDDSGLRLAATDGPLLRRIRRVLTPRAAEHAATQWLAAVVPATIALAVIATSIVRGQSATPDGARTVPPDRGVVEGRVIDAVSQRAIAGATIQLTGPTATLETTSGPDGRYEATSLSPGNYRVSAWRDGYLSTPFGTSSETEALVGVEGGHVTSNIDIRLRLSAAISGRVLGPDGNGAQGIELELLVNRSGAGKQGMPIAFAQSESGGEYRFNGLATGEYWVRAYANNHDVALDALHDRRAANAQGGISAIRSTYFPGVPHVDEAASLRVDSGQELFGTDFTLLTAATHRVEGRLVSAAGDFARTEVHLIPRGGYGTGAALVAHPSSDGRFVIDNVVPGAYTLMVMDRHPSQWMAALKEVDVEEDDVRDLLIVARPPATVDGRIIADASATSTLNPKGMRVLFEIAFRDGSVRMVGGPDVGRDGQFASEAPSDEVRVNVELLPPNWMIQKIIVDGTEASGSVHFDGGRHHIDVVLTDRLTHVLGRVVDRTGRAVPDAEVAIFPADLTGWTPGPGRFRPIRVLRDGTFVADGLRPAEYMAAEITGLARYDLLDPDTLKRLSAIATHFHVSDGERIAIRVVRGSR